MYRIKDLWIWDVLREMKKRWWIKSFVLLFVFLSSSLAIAFIVKRDWDNLNERHQAQTELNTQLSSDYFKKELAEAQNITESIESGTVGNSGDSAKFAKTAKYMVKKYPDIYSLQLIHGYQSIDVYHKKATRVGKSSLLGEARVKKAFEYCRKERINGIVGPIKTGKDKNSLVVCKPIFINLMLAISIQSSGSINVENSEKSRCFKPFDSGRFQRRLPEPSPFSCSV